MRGTRLDIAQRFHCTIVTMEKSSVMIDVVEGGDDDVLLSFNDQRTNSVANKKCRHKKLFLVTSSLLVATFIVIATSLAIGYSKGGINSSGGVGSIFVATSEDTESIVSASSFRELPWGEQEGIETTTTTGNTSDFITAKPDYFSTRQSSSSSSCPAGQGLWNLKLTTDWYGYETKWSLLITTIMRE